MKYLPGSLRCIRNGLWQARYTYQEVDNDGTVRKKQKARNFHAETQKEAIAEKERIREELEREALLKEMTPKKIVPKTLQGDLRPHR